MKFFWGIIGSSTLISSLVFTSSIVKCLDKVNYERNSLVKVVNDKSFLADKPVLYQFESNGINYYLDTIPLQYKKINWDLPLHKLVGGLDSFDGKTFFKDYSLKLAKEFDYLSYGQNYTFVNVLNDVNFLKSSFNNEIGKAKFYIEQYKYKKNMMSKFLDDFKKDDSSELDLNKMSIAEIKNFIACKFDVYVDLDDLTYGKLVELCDDESNQMKIKEIDEAIEKCELYKGKYESKLTTLNDMTKELVASFNKFVAMWKEKNSWFKNYDTEKEMVTELKKDYEKNKNNNFMSPSFLLNDDFISGLLHNLMKHIDDQFSHFSFSVKLK